MKRKDVSTELKRVALYIRVSGEEQKIHGLSLEAQQERLETYARERGWIITGIYIDAAKTARKNLHKRAEFQRMIESVKRNEIDILLFCRLDRWFRSVADYYKVMEILQEHHCEWLTTDEEYDTTTANGRLYINVKLSIAQNEADIDGERIDVVFDSKIAHGTVVSGSCPFGFRVNEEKKLEIVEDKASIVQDAFSRYESTVSQRGTIKYIREKYGVNWCPATFQRMLHEKLYTGIYDRGGRINENFCPPIITHEQFDHVQKLTKKNARSVPSGKIYIFTSILVCNECNHKLVGYQTRNYYYYRCNQHFHRGRCTHNHSIREDKIEAWLFEHLGEEIDRCKLKWEVQAAARKRAITSNEKAVLKRKLSKLKELYVNELIDIEEYKKDYEIYNTALHQLPETIQEAPPDFEAARKLLTADFKEIYNTLTREEKRTLWRSVIDEIKIDNNSQVKSIFFE
ncbi:recombinase family protein [Lachnospiraceae bacterium 38-14]|nr:recombinase family protein [Lachnospiraceae bacterium]